MPLIQTLRKEAEGRQMECCELEAGRDLESDFQGYVQSPLSTPTK